METQNSQHIPDSQDEQLIGKLHLSDIAQTDNQQSHSSAQASPSVSTGNAKVSSAQPVFYFQDDDQQPSDPFGTLVTPFQLSGEIPPMHSATGQRSAAPTLSSPSDQGASSPGSRSFPLWRVLILVLIIIVVILTGTIAVFAQIMSPVAPGRAAPVGTPAPGQSVLSTPPQKELSPTPVPPMESQQPALPTPVPTGEALDANEGQSPWIPKQLPEGWKAAGLSIGDALFAQRTAMTFTDREMSLDYRSVGTRARHGGTLTAALFILTPNAQARFARNDLRMMNNVLFDTVAKEKRIQVVINAQPSLIKFATVGQQQFAWVGVTFQLWRSRIDPATGERIEGVDMQEGTAQLRIYHMQVLLLRVPHRAQGANPPMGGTGWLVSTYGLDLPDNTMLDIIQPA